MFEIPGKHVQSWIWDSSNNQEEASEEEKELKSQSTIGSPTDTSNEAAEVSSSSKEEEDDEQKQEQNVKREEKAEKPRSQEEEKAANPSSKGPPSDMDLMREKFSKLLLGEDMSGGGKGVSSALALSNAITNLAASVFGEQRKLEPMSEENRSRWKKEMDWLLSVSDYIVEFVPSQQKSKDGTNMEVMTTQQRRDLLMNVPALRKLDAMLIGCLDNFKDEKEFWYVSKDADESEKGVQRDDKWWLPTVKVPPEGLSENSRKWLQVQKESVNQVLKASMAINAQVLSEMEIPDNYIDSLPKNGRASLGDSIYKSITVDFFDPADFLSSMDLTTEHKVLDLKNRIEASIVIWKRKMNHKDAKSWTAGVSLEKREVFEDRAETILLILKQRFPGLPQSSLDISKIQENRDVGFALLESYSRVLESLAYTVLSRIEDVLYAHSLTQDPPPSVATPEERHSVDSLPYAGVEEGPPESIEDSEKPNNGESPNSSKTLSDFMGWDVGGKEGQVGIKKNLSTGNVEHPLKDDSEKLSKSGNAAAHKKFFHVDKLEMLGVLKSPAR
ncbi:hypothetical protein NMG60_11021881 [Bertholletia excelsa]